MDNKVLMLVAGFGMVFAAMGLGAALVNVGVPPWVVLLGSGMGAGPCLFAIIACTIWKTIEPFEG